MSKVSDYVKKDGEEELPTVQEQRKPKESQSDEYRGLGSDENPLLMDYYGFDPAVSLFVGSLSSRTNLSAVAALCSWIQIEGRYGALGASSETIPESM
jgi:hypothetical protein